VIKGITSIGFILTIDNMFSKNAPPDIIKGAKDTIMVFGKD
jgi:hypothetical protein